MRWEPPPSTQALPYTPPSLWTGLARGARDRCPVCGEGRVFAGYLRLAPCCTACAAPLGALRADDAPPYFTILIAGHLLVPLALWVERTWMPPMWLHMALWLPLFTLASLVLLRPVKGAVVGWMMALGFTGAEHGPDPLPTAAGPAPRPGAVAARPRPTPGGDA